MTRPHNAQKEAAITVSVTSGSSEGLCSCSNKLTMIVGSVLLLIILSYILHRRRNGATVTEIMRLKRRSLSTVQSSPYPHNRAVTALPIYREQRYSVRSSGFSSIFSGRKGSRYPTSSMLESTPIHPRTAKNVYAKNAYFQRSWRPVEVDPESERPSRAAYGPLAVDTTLPIMRPENNNIMASKRKVAPSPLRYHALESVSKPAATFAVSAREELAHDEDVGRHLEDGKLPTNTKDRWSWTNSQAPATPRFYAPSRRSSISTLPRFRTIKSWVQGQAERNPHVPKEVRPMTTQAMLKNKASLPTLAPPPPVKKKLSKPAGQASRTRRSSSIVKPQPGGETSRPSRKTSVAQDR